VAASDSRRNVVELALFMLTGIVHRPSLRLYLSQNQLVDHLKFRIDLVESFLVKYSVLHGGSGHHDGDNIVKRPVECLFQKNAFHRKECKPTKWCCLQPASQKKGDSILLPRCDDTQCISGCFVAKKKKKNY
jgi:hypothetical protein